MNYPCSYCRKEIGFRYIKNEHWRLFCPRCNEVPYQTPYCSQKCLDQHILEDHLQVNLK